MRRTSTGPRWRAVRMEAVPLPSPWRPRPPTFILGWPSTAPAPTGPGFQRVRRAARGFLRKRGTLEINGCPRLENVGGSANFEHRSPLQEFVVWGLRRLHSCIGDGASPRSISPCYISSSIVSRAGHSSCVSQGHSLQFPATSAAAVPGSGAAAGIQKHALHSRRSDRAPGRIRHVGSSLPRRRLS
jgi:hypothetical protein